MCGNIHSESNALTLGNMKLLPEFISNAMKSPRHLSTYALDYCKNFPSHPLSLDFIPFHASKTEVALSSHHFWLKNLGWHRIRYKREIKLISLILNSLHNLTSNTAPMPSQAEQPFTTPGACMPLDSTSMPSFTLFPFARESLYFPSTYPNTI